MWKIVVYAPRRQNGTIIPDDFYVYDTRYYHTKKGFILGRNWANQLHQKHDFPYKIFYAPVEAWQEIKNTLPDKAL